MYTWVLLGAIYVHFRTDAGPCRPDSYFVSCFIFLVLWELMWMKVSDFNGLRAFQHVVLRKPQERWCNCNRRMWGWAEHKTKKCTYIYQEVKFVYIFWKKSSVVTGRTGQKERIAAVLRASRCRPQLLLICPSCYPMWKTAIWAPIIHQKWMK